MKNISLILIDPQAGFCSPTGSLALQYGREELREIEAVIPKINKAIEECTRRHLVVSEYLTGQFTNGDTKHPLSNLCVPETSRDCMLIEPLASASYHSYTVKNEQSAISSISFCSEIDHDLKAGIKYFVLSGFLFEHCVKSTAIDLASKLSGKSVEVIVCSDLVASRSQKYINGRVAEAANELRHNGVKFKPWHEIQR